MLKGCYMAKKKKICTVCGANLTGKNAPRVFDEAERKVKNVCEGSCYRKWMMKNWRDKQ
ncbi:MAG: hypothetical protein IKK97_05965 [Phascolarctobacterium sp.]|nr:hypothetical protein [Phascolarctobacterium sp.]